MLNRPARIFISYAFEDESLRKELDTHLKLLERRKLISTWSARAITAGEEWKGQIAEQLENADIILLLVSASFLASDYCYDIELKRALERHEARSVRVIPIVVRKCDWHDAPFAKLQALPRDAKPVMSWSDRDEAWTDVARALMKVIETLQPAPETAKVASAAPAPKSPPVTSRSRKLKILMLAANPSGMPALKLDEEFRLISNKIKVADLSRSIELVPCLASRLDDLFQALLEHQPDVVHFSGHGSEWDEILLVGDDGEAKPVPKEALASLFRALKDNVRLVVLNACYSHPQALAIVEHIDCAVGMNKAIADGAAIKFAAQFYQTIAYGRSVETAFEVAGAMLAAEGLPDKDVPVLLLRNGVDAKSVTLFG